MIWVQCSRRGVTAAGMRRQSIAQFEPFSQRKCALKILACAPKSGQIFAKNGILHTCRIGGKRRILPNMSGFTTKFLLVFATVRTDCKQSRAFIRKTDEFSEHQQEAEQN